MNNASRGGTCKTKAATSLAFALGLIIIQHAGAAETSGTHLPLGVNTALPALYPPAGGTALFDYNVAYSSGQYRVDLGNPNPPNFHILVYAQAFKVNHTWLNLTPDITIGSAFAMNFIHQSLQVGKLRGDNGFQVGDPALLPYFIQFNVTPQLVISHVLNIFPNWGRYSRKNLVNAGLGFTSYVPELELTYQPNERVEVSLDGWSGFNTTNRSTKYHTGNEFNMDYIVGYRPLFERAPGLQLGINGFIYNQWTDDTQNNVRVGNGNRGRVFAIGPSIRYDIGHGGLLVKWQHELAVQNRSTGDRFWFQFAVPL